MEKERVICLGTSYQPLYGFQYIVPGRKSFRTVVGQHDNIFPFKTPVLCRAGGVSGIVVPGEGGRNALMRNSRTFMASFTQPYNGSDVPV